MGEIGDHHAQCPNKTNAVSVQRETMPNALEQFATTAGISYSKAQELVLAAQAGDKAAMGQLNDLRLKVASDKDTADKLALAQQLDAKTAAAPDVPAATLQLLAAQLDPAGTTQPLPPLAALCQATKH